MVVLYIHFRIEAIPSENRRKHGFSEENRRLTAFSSEKRHRTCPAWRNTMVD